jgi:predicted transposase/invertase (TIGR01784 family)
VLLLYILEFASGSSDMPHLQPTIVVRTTRFMTASPGDTQEKKDWITFFTRAHEMTEEEVAAQIKTPEVLEAFEMAKFSNFTPELRASYEAEARERNDTAELIRLACETTEKSAKIAAKIEVARKLLAMNLTVDQIEEATGLSSEDIKSIM